MKSIQKESQRKQKKEKLRYKQRVLGLSLSICLCLIVLLSHWTALVPADQLIGLALQDLARGKEWNLEEEGLSLTLSREGIFWGKTDHKQKLMDLSQVQDQIRLSGQAAGSQVPDPGLGIHWQKKGYQYLTKDGQNLKFQRVEASLGANGPDLVVYLGLNASIKRIEICQKELKLGFWVSSSQAP